MKLIYIFLLLSTNLVYSQLSFKKARIQKLDNTELTGYIKIKNNLITEENAYIIYKNDNKKIETIIKADLVKSIYYTNKNLVVKKIINKKKTTYKFLEIVKTGDITIYKLQGRYYLESDENGLRDISIMGYNHQIERYYAKGIITKYVSKCKEAHNMVYKDELINLFDLRKIIDSYNSCKNYQSENSPSEAAIRLSESNDTGNLMIGFGSSYNMTDYTKLLRISEYGLKNNSISYYISSSIVLTPDFLKKLGFIKFNGKYVTQAWSNLVNDGQTVQIKEKIEYVGLGTGFNIYLIKSETIKPYIGLNGEFLINYSKIVISDSSPLANLYSKEHYTNFLYGLNLGANINLKNSEFNLNIEYSPGYKTQVKSPGSISGLSETDNQTVKTKYINFSLSYFIL